MNLSRRLRVDAVLIVLVLNGIYAPCGDALAPTVPKCCSLGESLGPNSECVESDLDFDPPFWPEESELNLVLHKQCESGWYLLDPEKDPRSQFSILENSTLIIPKLTDQHLTILEYCLDSVERNSSVVVLPYVCFSHDVYSSLIEGKMEVEEPTDIEEEPTLDGGNIPMIPKCCLLHQALNDNSECVKSDLEFEPRFFNGRSPEAVDLLVGLRCQDDWFRLDPRQDFTDEFHLMPNGSLIAPYLFDVPLTPRQYCLDSVETENGSIVLPMVCFPPLPWDETLKKIVMSIYPIGCLVSVPFLIFTLAVFLTLKTKSLRTKVLVSFLAAVTVSYISLAVKQLFIKESSRTCKALAFIRQLSSLSSFFWLNILSIYAWWIISLAENHKPSTVALERKYFVYFSFYGWLTPLVILTFPHLMNYISSMSGPKEEIEEENGDICMILEDTSTVVYYHGPIVVLLIFCIMSFAQTWRIIHRNQARDIPQMTLISWIQAMRNRKKMVIKSIILWFMMGLSWICEMVNAWTEGSIAMWVLSDCIHTIFGLSVFFMFLVLDRTMRQSIRKSTESLCCTKI